MMEILRMQYGKKDSSCKPVYFRRTLIILLTFMFISVQSNSQPRRVRVGVFPAAPLVMVEDGKPQGLFIDLVDYFAKQLDWKVEYVEGKWSDHLASLERGDIDLLPAVGYSPERERIYDFSRNAVYIDSGVLFANPAFKIHTIFDLRGRKVAALRGSIFTKGFIDYIGSFGVKCNIIYTDTNEAVMSAVSDNDADAGVCIYSLGNELAPDYRVTITPISFSPVALHFAVPSGKNGDLIAGIDQLMLRMISDPDSLYSRSYSRWTALPASRLIPQWIWWLLSGLALAAFILVSWSFILKRQVKSKTVYLQKEITEHKKAEERLVHALNEKEALIMELYHRTRNTMQMISALVILQAEEFPGNKDLRLLVEKTDDRIQAISLVHQLLYRSHDLSRISIKDYIAELSASIIRQYAAEEGRISAVLDVEDRGVLIDTMIPLGLILNELITNSLQHGFPEGRSGSINITIKGDESGMYLLRYSDNGVGVPEGFDFRNANTFGLKLIYSLGEEQLMGKVNFAVNNGVSCIVEINTGMYTARV